MLNTPPKPKPRKKSPQDATKIKLDSAQKFAAREVISLICCGAQAASGEWCHSIVLPRSLLKGEQKKEVAVGAGLCRVTIPGELVWIDFDIDETMITLASEFRSVLRSLMPPFIDRIGDVVVEDTPKGMVVRRKVGP